MRYHTLASPYILFHTLAMSTMPSLTFCCVRTQSMQQPKSDQMAFHTLVQKSLYWSIAYYCSGELMYWQPVLSTFWWTDVLATCIINFLLNWCTGNLYYQLDHLLLQLMRPQEDSWSHQRWYNTTLVSVIAPLKRSAKITVIMIQHLSLPLKK